MEELDSEIILGQGFDDIKLGMEREEVLAILDSPSYIDEYAHDTGGEAHTYYYDDIGVELTFESEDDFRLSYISVSNDRFHLKQSIRNGQTMDEVLKLVKHIGFSEAEVEDVSESDDENHELVSFEPENLNLWFIDGILDEIEIGPFWRDDDTPIWPSDHH